MSVRKLNERFVVNTDTSSSWVEVCDSSLEHTNGKGLPVARVLDAAMAELLADALNTAGWIVERGLTMIKDPTAEADVTVNGQSLTQQQACTIRMALNHYIADLNQPHVLKEDARYRTILSMYRLNANEVLRIMHGEG